MTCAPVQKRYEVEFTKSARKEFLSLPKRFQDKVIEALALLTINPYTELLQVKRLKGPDALLRIRLGDYRLLYKIDGDSLVVLVVKIGHRREVYRRR